METCSKRIVNMEEDAADEVSCVKHNAANKNENAQAAPAQTEES